MNKKMFFVILTLSLVTLFGAGVLAAPETLSSDYTGSSDIINVTNPDNGITTFKKHSVVSVTGSEGVIISLYYFDPDIGKYVVYAQNNGKDSWKIGPSGLFVKRMPISTGVNHIGIFAQLDDNKQFITRRVDRANQSIRNKIKSIFINNINDIIKIVNSK